ncbi:hypothetical protein ACIRPK_35840 [Kitasatospora sp. NPDC101801]|uniref:hypothetical protein n=1 Tax=Kitasatospora sp. NPDC101801 TaxID=3364103 RepID=UPI0037F6BDBB
MTSSYGMGQPMAATRRRDSIWGAAPDSGWDAACRDSMWGVADSTWGGFAADSVWGVSGRDSSWGC